ncbi:MAG: choice-of-anchor J domain-containing protein [Bacteroidales bacterium]|nr:choice-of-anchor J domain-containing protein [Bacteroidales bacterium]
MKLFKISFILIVLFTSVINAQTTIKVMQYNLLYYGKDVYDCTSQNNGMDHKNEQLQVILNYVQPDILCVNEMDASTSDVNYLMNNVLNINGESHWQHANVSGSYTINMIYYRSDKVSLVSQQYINGDPRQTDVYNLKSVEDNSIDLTLFVGHLKAGNTDPDGDDRAYSTQNVMNYINDHGAGNYLMMGDLNVYSSSEQCFQNLISPSNINYAFNDPVNRLGSWSSNYSFADVHTQATHTSGDCFVSGGMDDRFDFILISNDIKNGSNGISYIANSYETIGQDGNHYNDALTDGTNNSAPSEVITALYEMSDHLPVALELSFQTANAPVTIFNKTFEDQDLNSGGWHAYSVSDDERVWEIPSDLYGHNGTYMAKMTGWDYTNNVAINNEDWLISPSVDLNSTHDEVLTFWTAGKYNGPDLQALYSVDYSGFGDPNNATWMALSNYNLSTDYDYIWEESNNIDVSEIEGTNITFAFKYTSTSADGARTWQIDDILLEGLDGSSSVHEIYQSMQSWTAYPNPFSDKILLKNDANENLTLMSIVLVNMQGRVIYNETGKLIQKKNYEIDLTGINIPSGLYLIKISDGTNQKVIKIIK